MNTHEKNDKSILSSSSMKGELNDTICDFSFNKGFKKMEECHEQNLKRLDDSKNMLRSNSKLNENYNSIQKNIGDSIINISVNNFEVDTKNSHSDNTYTEKSFKITADNNYVFISDSGENEFQSEEFQINNLSNNLSFESGLSENILKNNNPFVSFSKEDNINFLNKVKNIYTNKSECNKKKYYDLIKNADSETYSKCWIRSKCKKNNFYGCDKNRISTYTTIHNYKKNFISNNLKSSYKKTYDEVDNSIMSIPSNRASHTCDIVGNKIFLFGGWNGHKALNDLYVYDIEQKKWFFVDYEKSEYYFEKIKELKRSYLKMNYYLLEKNITYKNISIPNDENETSEEDEEIEIEKIESDEIEIEKIESEEIESKENENVKSEEEGESRKVEIKEELENNNNEKYNKTKREKKDKQLKSTINLNNDFDYYSLFSKRISINYSILNNIDEETILEDFKIPLPRNNHASCCVNEKIYIFGGHDSTKWLDDMYVLDVSGVVNSLSILNLRNNKNIFYDEKCTEESSSCSDISSSLNSEESEININHSHNYIYFVEIKRKELQYWPSERACHTINAVKNKLYLFGGFDGNDCSNYIEIFDIERKEWSYAETSGSIPCARNAHSMINLNNNLYLYGGRSMECYLNDMFMLNTKTLIWSEIEFPNFVLPCVAGHTSCFLFKKIFLFGGYNGKERVNKTYIIDIKTRNITLIRKTTNTPHCRQRHTCCVYKKKQIFIFGGFDGNTWYNDLYIFDGSRLEQKLLTDISIKKLLKVLHSLVNNPQFSDITIIVQKKKIYAHKNILCAHSSYFKSLFSNNTIMNENNILKVNDWSYESYIKMIEFLYTGELKNIHNISYTILTEVMGLSNEYSIHILKGLCINALINKINVNNACYLLKYADLYNAYELKYQCLTFVKCNSQNIIFTKGFEELKTNPSLIIEISRLCLNRL